MKLKVAGRGVYSWFSGAEFMDDKVMWCPCGMGLVMAKSKELKKNKRRNLTGGGWKIGIISESKIQGVVWDVHAQNHCIFF